ncbi:hypothetical protein OUZ56_016134 [Daphnia magna]|uniref:Uncharacterized protein n=1 Tax=Daphnia magna TaxID=35525 RepID=A0ABR0APR5_9CRUS|nr:hypothetical protein OUZ56_016134 [Daphnia magna]
MNFKTLPGPLAPLVFGSENYLSVSARVRFERYAEPDLPRSRSKIDRDPDHDQKIDRRSDPVVLASVPLIAQLLSLQNSLSFLVLLRLLEDSAVVVHFCYLNSCGLGNCSLNRTSIIAARLIVFLVLLRLLKDSAVVVHFCFLVKEES